MRTNAKRIFVKMEPVLTKSLGMSAFAVLDSLAKTVKVVSIVINCFTKKFFSYQVDFNGGFFREFR